ncbi:hypothetical protein VPHK460_0040 [Vibrio phage K460]
MIKTKEDLMNTYVKNPCEALETLYLTTCEGFGIKWRLGQQPTELQGYYRCFGVDKKTNSICVDVEGTELTLADFEPEVVAASEVKPTTKYKYTLVDKSPEEIYRAMLDGEVFYLDDCEMFWEDGSFWLDKDGGTRVTNIDNSDQICTRKEVKWQDEVLDCLRMPSVDGFEEELPTKITVSFDGEDFYLTDSEFLEAARAALKATGEIK